MRLDDRGGALSSMQTSNESPRELVRQAAVELTAGEDLPYTRLTNRSSIAQLREVVMATQDPGSGRGLAKGQIESVIVGGAFAPCDTHL
jgi:hypothetical protein